MFYGSAASLVTRTLGRTQGKRATGEKLVGGRNTEQIVLDGSKLKDAVENRHVWAVGRRLFTQGIKQETREAESSDKRHIREVSSQNVLPNIRSDLWIIPITCVEEMRNILLSHQPHLKGELG